MSRMITARSEVVDSDKLAHLSLEAEGSRTEEQSQSQTSGTALCSLCFLLLPLAGAAFTVRHVGVEPVQVPAEDGTAFGEAAAGTAMVDVVQPGPAEAEARVLMDVGDRRHYLGR